MTVQPANAHWGRPAANGTYRRSPAGSTVSTMQDHGASERLDAMQAMLLRDGLPDWLGGTFVSAAGPAVQVRPGTSAEVRRWVKELAREHGVRVEEDDSYFVPEGG
jgi:hypothetical protein